jgi:hypothetical protein
VAPVRNLGGRPTREVEVKVEAPGAAVEVPFWPLCFS